MHEWNEASQVCSTICSTKKWKFDLSACYFIKGYPDVKALKLSIQYNHQIITFHMCTANLYQMISSIGCPGDQATFQHATNSTLLQTSFCTYSPYITYIHSVHSVIIHSVLHSVCTNALQLHRGISTLVLLIILVIVSCTDLSSVLFTPVQQFHPTCPRTFYTCSTLYLFKCFIMSLEQLKNH